MKNKKTIILVIVVVVIVAIGLYFGVTWMVNQAQSGQIPGHVPPFRH